MPAPGELQLTSLLQTYLNLHRDEKKQPDPISLPFPWDEHDTGDDITPEQRAALIQSFRERSAMRDL